MALNLRQALAFAALCLLAGSAWIAESYAATGFAGPLRLFIHSIVMAAIFWTASWLRERQAAKWPVAQYVTIALWSALLFDLPSLLAAGSSAHLGELTQTLIFALVPAATVFVQAQRDPDSDGPRLLIPALAGLAGAALLIPFNPPESTASWLWLAALVASAGLCGIAAPRLHELLSAAPIFRTAAIVCTAGALVSGIRTLIEDSPKPQLSGHDVALEAALLLLVYTPSLLLTVWLLRELRPIPFSARIFAIILVTVVEGILLLRPHLTWTMPLGAALLLFATAALIRDQLSTAQPT